MVKHTKYWLLKNAINLMPISIGVVYVWFGMLKFFPALSPAELLAERTIEMAFFDLVEGHVYILFLAGWEVMLGVAFLLNYKLKTMIPVMLFHMLCTIIPVFATPEEVFSYFPYGLTLTGQYIVKNFVLVTAALFLLKYSEQETAQLEAI